MIIPEEQLSELKGLELRLEAESIRIDRLLNDLHDAAPDLRVALITLRTFMISTQMAILGSLALYDGDEA